MVTCDPCSNSLVYHFPHLYFFVKIATTTKSGCRRSRDSWTCGGKDRSPRGKIPQLRAQVSCAPLRAIRALRNVSRAVFRTLGWVGTYKYVWANVWGPCLGCIDADRSKKLILFSMVPDLQDVEDCTLLSIAPSSKFRANVRQTFGIHIFSEKLTWKIVCFYRGSPLFSPLTSIPCSRNSMSHATSQSVK